MATQKKKVDRHLTRVYDPMWRRLVKAMANDPDFGVRFGFYPLSMTAFVDRLLTEALDARDKRKKRAA